MRQAFILIIFLAITYTSKTQSIDTVYTVEKMQKTTSFAEMTLGGDILTLQGGTIALNGNKESLNPSFSPRLNVGAKHFWGHADLYVTFPLPLSIYKTPSYAKKYTLSESVETGVKIYPWAMKTGRLTPYAGISFQPFLFRLTKSDDNSLYGGPIHEKFITPIHLGLTYSTKKLLINLGFRYTKNNFSYHLNPAMTTEVNISPLAINFSIFRYFDIDKGYGSSAESVDQLNKKMYILKKHNKLNAWYYGIGPSTALQMSKSSHLKAKLPFLHDDMANSFLFPELSFGRYFHKYEFNASSSFRWMNWDMKAFDTKVKLQRVGLAIEAYKFLMDYHGFVPFIGPSFNVDQLSYSENGIKTRTIKPSLGIVFGWDIRVTHTGTSLLRTNLRYVPNLSLDVEGNKVMFDHLEFNFIQYVHFFGRGKVYNAYRKKS